MRVLVAIVCAGCGGVRLGAGPTVTTDGAIGVQATATLLIGTTIGIGGGAGARVDNDTTLASAVVAVDYTLPNVDDDHDTSVKPTRLTRIGVKVGKAEVLRPNADAAIGIVGFGVARMKVLRQTRGCTVFGSDERVGLGGEATFTVERHPTGSIGVFGAGITLQLDNSLSLRKCD